MRLLLSSYHLIFTLYLILGMGLIGYPFREPAGLYGWPGEAPEATQPRQGRFTRWLTPLLGVEASPLCRMCRRRKLDFRPLMEKPPGSLCKIVHNDNLDILERRNAVFIHGFSWQQAEATTSECSLCALLYWAANRALPKGSVFLPDIGPFMVTLRPRYDWIRIRGRQGKLIHRYQVFVQFEPFETEILFDMRHQSRQWPLIGRYTCTRRGRLISPPTFDTDVLKHWLNRCNTRHNHPMVSARLTSRMESIMSRGLFRVIHTTTGSVEALASHQSFVALSYVWGPAADYANHQPLESKPISAHAPTIRDAAVMASALGFEWLWVDRVCIDQTDESEKAVLIPYMKDIFAAAELTIAAACGDSAQNGLLGSPGTPRRAEKPLVSISSISLLPASLSLEDYLKKSAWGGRGWTFEEYVFSRRLLFIFETKILFNCGLDYYYDELRGHSLIGLNKDSPDRAIFGKGRHYTANLHARIQHNPVSPAELLDVSTFMSAIMDYSQRALTYRSDKIAAFAGVILASVEAPMDAASEQALLKHGSPLHFFEVLLTWEHGPFCKWTPLPDNQFAPSWSWASSPRDVSFYPVRNWLLSDPNPWFQYSLLLDNDILALPTNNNSIARLTGSQFPDELIADQPWIKSLSDELPFGHDEWLANDSPVCNPVNLPKLHIVTFLFDARFVYEENVEREYLSTYALLPKSSKDTSGDLNREDKLDWMSDDWSIHPDLKHHYSPNGIKSRTQQFETFAIITGRTYHHKPSSSLNYSLFIMLLGRTAQQNTYTRVGLRRADSITHDKFTALIATGEPRWQYICIV